MATRFSKYEMISLLFFELLLTNGLFSFFLLSNVLRIIVTNLRRVPPEIARSLALLVSFSFVLLLLLSPSHHAYGVSLDRRMRAPVSVQIRSTWPPGLKNQTCKVASCDPRSVVQVSLFMERGASLEGSKWFHFSSIRLSSFQSQPSEPRR